MKYLLTALLFILVSVHSFSQTSTAVKSKDYYLTKSHRQKTIAWIMAGGGVALTALGFAIESTNAITDSKSDNGANAIGIVGLVSAAGSIPLFISAAHNKKMAATVSASFQRVPVINTVQINSIFQPSITFKISL